MFSKADDKKFQGLSNSKKRCNNCGHTFVWLTRKSYVICSHCGHKVYASKQDEFKDKLKTKIIKGSVNDEEC